MLISSTVRPSGQAAIDLVTGPSTVSAGAAQEAAERHAAIMSGTAGPSMRIGTRPAPPLSRSPGPPAHGTLPSAVPWTCRTATGAGCGQSPMTVPATGAIAEKTVLSQASQYAIIAPLDMPVTRTRDVSTG